MVIVWLLHHYNRTYPSQSLNNKNNPIYILTNSTFVTIFVLDCEGRVDLYVNLYYNKRLKILNTRNIRRLVGRIFNSSVNNYTPSCLNAYGRRLYLNVLNTRIFIVHAHTRTRTSAHTGAHTNLKPNACDFPC